MRVPLEDCEHLYLIHVVKLEEDIYLYWIAVKLFDHLLLMHKQWLLPCNISESKYFTVSKEKTWKNLTQLYVFQFQ